MERKSVYITVYTLYKHKTLKILTNFADVSIISYKIMLNLTDTIERFLISYVETISNSVNNNHPYKNQTTSGREIKFGK